MEQKKILDYMIKDISWKNTEEYLELVFNELNSAYRLRKLTLYETMDLKLKALDLLIKLDQWHTNNLKTD